MKQYTMEKESVLEFAKDFVKNNEMKLFPWQKKVLEDIDAGKRMFVSAPRMSGRAYFRIWMLCAQILAGELEAEIALKKFKQNSSYWMGKDN
jgi:hypothetical protein